MNKYIIIGIVLILVVAAFFLLRKKEDKKSALEQFLIDNFSPKTNKIITTFFYEYNPQGKLDPNFVEFLKQQERAYCGSNNIDWTLDLNVMRDFPLGPTQTTNQTSTDIGGVISIGGTTNQTSTDIGGVISIGGSMISLPYVFIKLLGIMNHMSQQEMTGNVLDNFIIGTIYIYFTGKRQSVGTFDDFKKSISYNKDTKELTLSPTSEMFKEFKAFNQEYPGRFSVWSDDGKISLEDFIKYSKTQFEVFRKAPLFSLLTKQLICSKD